MSIIEITKAFDVRRYIRYRINTDDLTEEQREFIEDEILIMQGDGCDHDEVESILNNNEWNDKDSPDYQESDKPEVIYVVAEL